ENKAGFGMIARRAADRQGGAAQHALEAAHQVVMADQAKVAVLAKPNTDFVKRHAGESHLGPLRGPSRRGSGKESRCTAPLVGVSGMGANVRHLGQGIADLGFWIAVYKSSK